MTTSDEQDAIKALAHRLTEWGVDGAADKAKLYVTDLVNHGWAMQANRTTGRRPPPAGSPEECRTHIGEWRVNCRCCIAERKAERDEAAAVIGGGWNAARIRETLRTTEETA